MDPKTQKIVRKVARIVLGSMYAYVGAATMAAGMFIVAKEVRK